MKNLTPFLALTLTLLTTIPASAAVAPPMPPIPPMPSVFGPEVQNGNRLAEAVATTRPDKQGRILVPAFTIADAQWTSEGNRPSSLILGAPVALYPLPDTTMATYIESDIFTDKPSLHNKAEVVLTSAVVAGLRDLGIKDPVAHFKGRIIQVRGVRHGIFVGNNGNNGRHTIYMVVVDRLEDIKVTDGDSLDSSAITDTPDNPDAPEKN